MNPEQVNKSIRQMRQIFGFFGVLTAIAVIGTLCLVGSGEEPSPALCLFPICPVYLLAYYGLGKRNKSGYQLAQLGSIFLLLGFPILTLFGISYLSKLSKPEMKQAFGIEMETGERGEPRLSVVSTEKVTPGAKPAVVEDVSAPVTPNHIPLMGHVGLVRAVGVSADGSIIATGSYDATVRLWNPATGQEVGKLNVDSDIGVLTLSQDGTKVVIGCKSNFVEVWDIQSGERLVQMPGHKNFPCSSIDCSKDGRWAVTASWDEPGVFLWNLDAGKLERQIIPEDASRAMAVSVAFAPDSTHLAIGCADGVFICEVPSGKTITRLEGHPGARCNYVKYLNDDTVVSIGASSDVKIQSVSKGTMLRQQRLVTRETISAGAVSDDGKRVAIGMSTASEWDLETGSAILENNEAHEGKQVRAVRYVPGTYTWVSGDVSGKVILWNPASPAIPSAAASTRTAADRIQDLEEVLKQRPEWASGHEQLALEYWGQGDVVNMFRHFFAATKADPDSNQPHKYLKEIYAALGYVDDYAREDAADKRTDSFAHVGGTELTQTLRSELQMAAKEHGGKLEAVIRELKA